MLRESLCVPKVENQYINKVRVIVIFGLVFITVHYTYTFILLLDYMSLSSIRPAKS